MWWVKGIGCLALFMLTNSRSVVAAETDPIEGCGTVLPGLAPSLSSQKKVPLDVGSFSKFKAIWDEVRSLEGRTLKLADGITVQLGERLGKGQRGIVYCIGPACKTVIKFPLHEGTLKDLRAEWDGDRKMRACGIATATILNAEEKGTDFYLIKERIEGDSLFECAQKGFSKRQIEELAQLFIKGEAGNLFLDLQFGNWHWDSTRETFVCVDQMLHPMTEKKDIYNFGNWRDRLFSGSPDAFKEFRARILQSFRERKLSPPPEEVIHWGD